MWNHFDLSIVCMRSNSSMGCTLAHEKYIPEDAYAKSPPRPDLAFVHQKGDDTFSEHHKQLLRQTWKTFSINKQAKGVAIFLEIFSMRPEAKSLFPFRDLSSGDLIQNALFRSHAMRFMNAVENTIVSLDALDLTLVPVLHRLGRRHVSIPGFQLDFLPSFMNALLHVVEHELGKRCTNDVREAWLHLARFIAATMTDGYNEGLQENAIKEAKNSGKSKDLRTQISFAVNQTSVPRHSDNANVDNGNVREKDKLENGRVTDTNGVSLEEVPDMRAQNDNVLRGNGEFVDDDGILLNNKLSIVSKQSDVNYTVHNDM